jgi:uncharacterized protein (TIGR00369 family)
MSDENFQKLLDKLANAFSVEMPFMRKFDMKVVAFTEETAELRFEMNENLVGNMVKKILHGGATASVLDSVCGMLAMGLSLAKNKSASFEDQLAKVAKSATVDLRIDYLRPGLGKYFITKAHIVRRGNSISVIRGELFNDKDVLIATSIGNYISG